jgi:hypothetical protein
LKKQKLSKKFKKIYFEFFFEKKNLKNLKQTIPKKIIQRRNMLPFLATCALQTFQNWEADKYA